ncbi:hypothetical protein [Streptomyces sp. NRRL S-1868]|uniref:hypothetical protein n=1 Tax=Streptomyces sp. NRRL S-1868 TaxID=1463892 RepID=UPI00131DEFAC|nr:hypothetical protein [Streptomyces sp. NRRL S-1868]
MSALEAEVLASVLADWPDAWRHPTLFALSAQGAPTDAATAADALLTDLMEPATEPADCFGRLVDAGEFAAARALLAQPGTGLSGELAGRIDRAVAAARNRLQPRAHHLETQARALNVSAGEGTWSALLSRSRREAEAELDRLAAHLATAAEERRAAVEAYFPELDEERARIARACLESGEYAVAEQVATQPEPETWLDAPATVPRPSWWDYPQHADEEALRWFTGEAPAPPDFGQHLPAPGDTQGRELIDALHEVYAGLTAQSAQRLAAALDALVSDVPVRYRPQQAGDGFSVELCGFTDRRFPWLALPGRLPLHIGAEPPADDRSPQLWLPTSAYRPPELPPGTALLEPRQLFVLVEPDSAGRAPNTQWRRVNLLRQVCARLPFAHVVDVAGVDLGDEADTRAALLWILDLLGFRTSPEVPDMALYYTAAVPQALAAVVRELSRTLGRPGRLTHEHLSGLRTSPEAVRAVRDAVFGLLDDLPARVVLGALLGRAAQLGGARVPAEALLDELDDLAVLVMEECEREGSREPDLRPERIDVDGALERIEAAGLAEPDQDTAPDGPDTGPGAAPAAPATVLPGQGLVALLAGEELTGWTVRELRRLHEDRDRVEEHARLVLLNRTTRQNEHARKGYEFAREQLLERLERTAEPAEREVLRRRIEALRQRIAEHEAIGRRDVEALVQSATFDLVALVREFTESQQHAGRATVEIVDETRGSSLVTATPVLVRLTLDDLVLNAAQAMDAADSPRRTVRITVRHQDTATERFVVADVEDSGPGFGNADRSALDLVRRRNGMPGGEGLRHAQRNLEACRGGLERLPDRSALGGAHLRIRLPQARTEGQEPAGAPGQSL